MTDPRQDTPAGDRRGELLDQLDLHVAERAVIEVEGPKCANPPRGDPPLDRNRRDNAAQISRQLGFPRERQSKETMRVGAND